MQGIVMITRSILANIHFDKDSIKDITESKVATS